MLGPAPYGIQIAKLDSINEKKSNSFKTKNNFGLINT